MFSKFLTCLAATGAVGDPVDVDFGNISWKQHLLETTSPGNNIAWKVEQEKRS